jgi:hypothetical protein
MAEQGPSNIGRAVPMEAEMGASMHGVLAETATMGTKSDEPSVQALDRWGRPFVLPVDSEHKAKKVNLFCFRQPHMPAFYLSALCFFASFFGTFAG